MFKQLFWSHKSNYVAKTTEFEIQQLFNNKYFVALGG